MQNKRPIKQRLWSTAAMVLLSCTMLVLLSCTLIAGQALPVGAENGDGSGGGSNETLTLVSSSPADGQREVTLTSDIQLGFNKNVINLSVRENNRKCFALSTADGKPVPIEVILADDQIYPERKREISVRPRQPLSPGTGYVLKILPQLKSKSGSVLGREVTVSFFTKGAAAEAKPDVPDAPAPGPEKPPEQPNTKPGAGTSPLVEPGPDSKPNANPPTPPSSNEPPVPGGGDMGNLNQSAAEDKPASESAASPVPEVESAIESPDAAGTAADNQAAEKTRLISPAVIAGLAGVIFLVLIGVYFYQRSNLNRKK